jgi:RNA polymerase-binding transcription factor DksA
MIDQNFIEKNKSRLLAEKVRLEKLLARVADVDKKGGDFHPRYEDIGSKDDENATEVAMYEEHIAEEFDLEQKLHKVERALERIEKGAYGLCGVGGEAVSLKRLEAVPEAETCIEHDK